MCCTSNQFHMTISNLHVHNHQEEAMQEGGNQLFSGHEETKRKRGEEGSNEEAHSPEIKLNRTCTS